MTNISKKSVNTIGKKSDENTSLILDKLAQLPYPLKTGASTIDKMTKRARAKYMTNSYAIPLAKLKSPLQKSYNNTIFGCCNVLEQRGDILTSHYCNNRWCLVCNRIRTAKLIKGYLPTLEQIPDKQFLTLTIPNVKADDLYTSIKTMIKTFQNIYRLFENNKTKLVGIRKLECTYNPIRGDFHPHFHLVIQDKDKAKFMLKEWLKRFPDADIKGQDIRPADGDSVYELFKYFTKIISNKAIYIEPLDAIFTAMHGLRAYQPFGIKKISEEVDELQSEVYDDIVSDDSLWFWLEQDWFNAETGEALTGYKPDERLIKLLSNIR